jgi:hypothetical protein
VKAIVLRVVESEADTHQCPVTDVLMRGKVSLEHQTHTHGIASVAGRVDGRAERVLKLELVSLLEMSDTWQEGSMPQWE